MKIENETLIFDEENVEVKDETLIIEQMEWLKKIGVFDQLTDEEKNYYEKAVKQQKNIV